MFNNPKETIPVSLLRVGDQIVHMHEAGDGRLTGDWMDCPVCKIEQSGTDTLVTYDMPFRGLITRTVHKDGKVERTKP